MGSFLVAAGIAAVVVWFPVVLAVIFYGRRKRLRARSRGHSDVTSTPRPPNVGDMVHPVERLPKPNAVLSLDMVASNLFRTLKQRFKIGCSHTLILDSIECTGVFDDPVDCAAVAMRKLQLLYLIADPDHDASSDVVVGLCVELIRELDQLQSVAPDIALDIEAGICPLQDALLEVSDALVRHAPTTSSCLVVFGR